MLDLFLGFLWVRVCLLPNISCCFGGCRKVFLTPPKAFDSSKKRVEGTEAAQFLSLKNDPKKAHSRSAAKFTTPPSGVGGQKWQSADGKGKKPMWKSRSEELQAAMKAARGYGIFVFLFDFFGGGGFLFPGFLEVRD